MGNVKKKAEQAAKVRERAADRVLCGVTQDGVATTSWEQLRSKHQPESREAEFIQCQKWAQENLFLGTLLGLKQSFYNYRFQIVPAEKLDEAGRQRFKEWHQSVIAKASKHALDVWDDYLTKSSAVSYWNADIGKEVGAMALALEKCNYSDRLGLRTLKYKHGLTATEREKLPADLKTRYQGADVLLVENGEKEGYRVLTLGRLGGGFGRPKMVSIFKEAGTMESMQLGEMLMGFYHRTMIRFHRLGYEVKQGTYSGSSKQHWKEDRWKGIEKFFKDRVGAVEASGNFDHKIEYLHPPIEYFNDKKWEGLQRRFVWWGGPLGWMLIAKTVSPFLMDILRVDAEKERELVGHHLADVIGNAYNAPVKVKVKWSSKCFKDMRLAADLMKWAVQQGPLSLRTAMEEMGEDWEEEQERKKVESELPDSQLHPRFDQNHNKGDKKPGKPKGTRDDG